MSSIMRGDQTVSLIQQYHANYPEIARNTQDVEGRKQRVHMWAKITEELNAKYNTNFTVEQFKKKVQNVQCTSRQKIQSGKRNLGDAEMEYMRLFEQDRLNNVEMAAKYGSFVGNSAINDDYNVSRLSVPPFGSATEDFNANSMGTKCKFMEPLMNTKVENLNGSEVDENRDDEEDRSTPSTSGAIGNFGLCSGANSGSNALNTIFNKTSGSTTNGNSNLDQAQQLLLAMMTNNFSAVANGIGSTVAGLTDLTVNNGGEGSKNVAEAFLSTMKNPSLNRKRTNLLTDNNNINNNNAACDNNNTSNANNSGSTFSTILANNENVNQMPTKRRRKQPHALHLSHLRPAEALLSLEPPSGEEGAAVQDPPSFCTGLAATRSAAGDCGQRSSSTPADTFVMSPSTDHRWRSDVVEMQKAILENQRRILGIMERQTMLHEEREVPDRRSSQSPPSPPQNARGNQGQDSTLLSEVGKNTSRFDAILGALCEKIDALSKALTSIDATLKMQMAPAKAYSGPIADADEKTSVANNGNADKLLKSMSDRVFILPSAQPTAKISSRMFKECIF